MDPRQKVPLVPVRLELPCRRRRPRAPPGNRRPNAEQHAELRRWLDAEAPAAAAAAATTQLERLAVAVARDQPEASIQRAHGRALLIAYEGATPLHHAAHAMKSKAVLLLLQHGADASIADKAGRTPRDDDAVANGRDSFASSIRTHLDRARQIRSEWLAAKEAAKAKPEL